eukprot:scaffold175911_cov31-Tisochrysis_lutea.AAC.3
MTSLRALAAEVMPRLRLTSATRVARMLARSSAESAAMLGGSPSAEECVSLPREALWPSTGASTASERLSAPTNASKCAAERKE